MTKKPTKKEAPAAPTVEKKVMALADLRPADYNPRDITPEELAGLKASIQRFGMVEPLVLNKTSGRIVGGHQRLKAMLELGYTETEVWLVELDDTMEKALNLTLNNRHIQGHFTEGLELLLADLAELPDLADLQLDKLSFDLAEIQAAAADLARPESKLFDENPEGKEDGNYFYIEYYGKDDLYARIKEKLPMRTPHEIDAEYFQRLILGDEADASQPDQH